MSAGGIFKLIANDGKADRMIMATELINQRIKDIMCMRAKQGFKDVTPTLVDLERTHILFVNAHFKPFAAIGYEYNKTRTNSGSSQFGETMQFSIPQFGDFFYDMVVNMVLGTVSCAAGTVPAYPADIGTANIAAGQSETDNLVTTIYRRYTYTYVNLDGTAVVPGAAASNFVRYCEYPGERLFRTVKFEVNGNPLDDYTSEAMVMYQKFNVMPAKQTGWKRLVGQEVPLDAYTDMMSITGTSPYNVEHANLTQNGTVIAAPTSPINAVLTAKKFLKVANGPQTPKVTQPELSLWVPLLFWCNRDVRLSIPSISIPYGQRFITIDVETQANMVFATAGNLFRKLQTEVCLNSLGTSAGVNTENYRTYITMEPVLATGSTVNTTQTIRKAELYIDNIFMNPEIHDIYIHRIGFSLVRVHRQQKVQLNTDANEILLSQMKWPIETMYVGVRPSFNVSITNPNQWRDWHRMTRLQDRYIDESARSQAKADASNAAGLANFDQLMDSQSQFITETLTYTQTVKTVDTVHILAYGINLFNEFSADFFSYYMPWQFGGVNIITPEDEGALMINFCLYPGTYQPSGHLNISRAREFYFKYTSSYITSVLTCDLIVIAVAINFLIIADGSAVLRYST